MKYHLHQDSFSKVVKTRKLVVFYFLSLCHIIRRYGAEWGGSWLQLLVIQKLIVDAQKVWFFMTIILQVFESSQKGHFCRFFSKLSKYFDFKYCQSKLKNDYQQDKQPLGWFGRRPKNPPLQRSHCLPSTFSLQSHWSVLQSTIW